MGILNEETFGSIAKRLEAKTTEGWIQREDYVTEIWHDHGESFTASFTNDLDTKFSIFARNCWPEIVALYEAVRFYEDSEGGGYEDVLGAMDDLDAKARKMATKKEAGQ